MFFHLNSNFNSVFLNLWVLPIRKHIFPMALGTETLFLHKITINYNYSNKIILWLEGHHNMKNCIKVNHIKNCIRKVENHCFNSISYYFVRNRKTLFSLKKKFICVSCVCACMCMSAYVWASVYVCHMCLWSSER